MPKDDAQWSHEEVLGRARDYLDGLLPKTGQEATRRHLERCGSCREIVEAWGRDQAPPWFAGRVMARLSASAARAESARLPLWIPLAGLLALGLLVAAFWAPQRTWLKYDQALVWRDVDHD